MISTIGRIPPMLTPIPIPAMVDSQQRHVADALGAEFFEHTFADCKTAAVAAYIGAHQEDLLVAVHGGADAFSARLHGNSF